MQRLGNDSGFSFKTPFYREQPVVPQVIGDRGNGESEDSIAVQTPAKVHGAQSRLELSSTEDEDGAETEDDGAETVEILPLSARSQDLDQAGDFHVDGAHGMESTKEQTAHRFQEVGCGDTDKIDRDHTGSENDASVYDVHVVDDICFSTEGMNSSWRCRADFYPVQGMCMYFLCEYIITIVGLEFDSSEAANLFIVGLESD